MATSDFLNPIFSQKPGLPLPALRTYDAVVLDGNHRSIRTLDHSLESAFVFHALLPAHAREKLAHLCVVGTIYRSEGHGHCAFERRR